MNIFILVIRYNYNCPLQVEALRKKSKPNVYCDDDAEKSSMSSKNPDA